MEITTAQIKFFKKGAFYSVYNENIRHTKVLPYLSIVQSVEGSYDIAIGNSEQRQTEEGGFFIAPSGIQQHIVHHVNKTSGKMTCRWVFVEIEVNKSITLDSLYQFPIIVNDNLKKELNILFDRIFATNDIWENYSDCYKMLGYLLKTAMPIKNTVHQGMQSALTYITEHYAEQITVSEMSNIANMSESNFYAAFRKHIGDSPIAYLNNYRLSITADKLAQTYRTIQEISYSVGINDPLYFSKLFKKNYGISPKEYRFMYLKQS